MGVSKGASKRPSLRSWSLFAVDWNLSVVGGGFVVLFALWQWRDDWSSMPAAFWVIAGLVILGELRPVITASTLDPNGVVTSNAFAFATMYLWGLWPAVILQTVATLVAEIVKQKEPWKVAFNVGQYAVSFAAAWLAMVVAGVPDGITSRPDDALSASDMPWIIATWVIWFLVNNALVAGVCADEGLSFREAFLDDIGYYVFTTLAVFAVAPLVVLVATESPFFLPLLLLPLFAVFKAGEISLEKEQQSLHDTLTGLPNRKMLVEELAAQTRACERGCEPFSLFMLDLDRFKEVNDTLGHQVGDRLLQLVATRLRGALRPHDLVARLGGDEFAMLLPGIGDAAAATEVAARIHSSLVEPFHLQGVLLELEASIGVALHPRHGADVEQLLRRADVAMYLAKDAHTGVEVYDVQRDQHSTDRLGLLAGLRHAIEAGELELHYQPKVSVPLGDVVGVEALVRWNQPGRGLVYPDEFVPLAETSGLMHRLTAFVVDTALAQVARWREDGLEIPVAVNVSARDLHGPELIPTIEQALQRHNLPARMLRLELTERVLMSDSPRVSIILNELEALGVTLSLDDFGTGYHSMVMLKRLPVTEIKVDRSFVDRLDAADDDASIVRSIIELAHARGLHAVAEGVETSAAWNLLESLGCDSAQGFYVGRPMPGQQATDWLRENTGRARDLQLVRDADAG